jgi:subtilase family serine protease
MNRENDHRGLRGLRSGGIAVAISALIALVPAAAGAVPTKPQRPVCPGPASSGAAICHAHVVTDHAGKPLSSTSPTGYGPAKFHGAYGLPNTSPVAQTIAIVDAYDDPTVASDLNYYSAHYGLPQCNTSNPCFKKVNQSGVAGSYPAKNAGWALEIALDVETAHQICQNCKILLVEATTNSFSNLAAAVNTAARLGATQISNSYGGGEWSGETSITAFDHPGVAVTASSGDGGYGSEYPAASPSVIAVGGTTLSVGAGNTWTGETAWSGSGSGCSSYLSARSWQTADPSWSLTGCGTKRGVADVAADANPSTGAAVYDTTRYQGRLGWFQVGGTSLSAPLVAGVYALAGNAASASYPATLAYQNDAQLHDVTVGSNGSCATIMCRAASGYDGPTGLGTPNGLGAF